VHLSRIELQLPVIKRVTYSLYWPRYPSSKAENSERNEKRERERERNRNKTQSVRERERERGVVYTMWCNFVNTKIPHLFQLQPSSIHFTSSLLNTRTYNCTPRRQASEWPRECQNSKHT
jgi:hypothetical protein